MRASIAIAKKELNVYFTTPIAYVVITVIAFFAALFFGAALDYFPVTLGRAAMQGMQDKVNLTEQVVMPVFDSISFFIVIASPFLTMRLVAEEKRNRTFELLMSAPVRPIEIVVGKYLAAVVVVATGIAIVAALPLTLVFSAHGVSGGSAIEWQTYFTGLLGLLLVGSMAMAIGLFFSSLTESVVVAALVSLLFFLLLYLVTMTTINSPGALRDLGMGLSLSQHLNPFLQGRIELKDLAYFLSFTAGGLWLTDRVIEGHRWA